MWYGLAKRGIAVGSPAFYVTNGGVQFGSTTGFVWDAANSRLGIGTSGPTNALDVNGTIGVDTTIKLLDNTFTVTKYTAGSTTLTITNTGHNGAAGINTTSAIGIRAASNLGVSGNNPLGASVYAAGGTNGSNISLGLLSNRALITSATTGMGMNTSAMLQVDSSTQGVLLPRMSAASKLAITNPAQGLLTYDTDTTTEGLWYYSSGSIKSWQRMLSSSGSQVISGSLTVTDRLIANGSFTLPLTSSVSPATGSAYWSGSFLFVYDGTQYRSASFY